MNLKDRIYVAGHQGMVGSALVRALEMKGFTHLITRTHDELDLTDQSAVNAFFAEVPIDVVLLAAAKVGGINANNVYRADFIYRNLMIQANVIHASFKAGVWRLLFLGSSCIYPKRSPQPIKEEHLLSGYLEPSNEPYAIAKIAGIHLCKAYNNQYGTDYRSVMPTNLYGPNDNFDLENSHVLPALIRKFHLAKLALDKKLDTISKDAAFYGPIPENIRLMMESNRPMVRLWGTGKARREFLHVSDLALACLHIMDMPEADYKKICQTVCESNNLDMVNVPHINVGSGEEVTIRQLAEIVKEVVQFKGEVDWDDSMPDGTTRKLLDTNRLTKTGWKHSIKLMSGIKDTYQWYLNQVC
jgi:GDP-L-fucose synthase